MPNIESEPRQHGTEFVNPPLDGHGLDTNMLTEQELIELGYKVNRERHREHVAKRCTDCKKPVANPITSYSYKGLELLEKGEAIHEGCLQKRKDALLDLIAQMVKETQE